MNKQTEELNRLNNQLEEQVSPENDIVLTDITCYLRGANISIYHQEVVRHDLLEMIVSAQKRGEDVKTVIGGDYKVFCDEIIENLPPRSKGEKVKEYLDILCSALSILFLINILVANGTTEIVRSLFSGKETEYHIPVTVGSVMSCILIVIFAYGIVTYIMNHSFEIGTIKLGKTKILGVGIAVVAVFVLIAWFGKATLFTINIFVALFVTLLLFLGHKALEKI